MQGTHRTAETTTPGKRAVDLFLTDQIFNSVEHLNAFVQQLYGLAFSVHRDEGFDSEFLVSAADLAAITRACAEAWGAGVNHAHVPSGAGEHQCRSKTCEAGADHDNVRHGAGRCPRARRRGSVLPPKWESRREASARSAVRQVSHRDTRLFSLHVGDVGRVHASHLCFRLRMFAYYKKGLHLMQANDRVKYQIEKAARGQARYGGQPKEHGEHGELE